MHADHALGARIISWQTGHHLRWGQTIETSQRGRKSSPMMKVPFVFFFGGFDLSSLAKSQNPPVAERFCSEVLFWLQSFFGRRQANEGALSMRAKLKESHNPNLHEGQCSPNQHLMRTSFE